MVKTVGGQLIFSAYKKNFKELHSISLTAEPVSL